MLMGKDGLVFMLLASKIPNQYCSLMNETIQTEYTSGNAAICLNKTKDYILTSVQSPREDIGFVRWENVSLGKKCDVNSHTYIKSLNERFHGTSHQTKGTSNCFYL